MRAHIRQHADTYTYTYTRAHAHAHTHTHTHARTHTHTHAHTQKAVRVGKWWMKHFFLKERKKEIDDSNCGVYYIRIPDGVG